MHAAVNVLYVYVSVYSHGISEHEENHLTDPEKQENLGPSLCNTNKVT